MFLHFHLDFHCIQSINMPSLKKLLLSSLLLRSIQAQKISSPKTAGADAVNTAQSSQVEAILRDVDWLLDMTQIKEQIRSRLPAMQSPDEPEGAVASWITSTLLPQTVQTAQELQADVDRAEQNVKECKNLLWSAEKEVAHRESILQKDESDKFQCIALEHRLHKDEMDACGDLKFLSELIVREKPPALTDLTNKTVDEIEHILKESQSFFSDYFPKMMDKNNACSAATEAAAKQHEECVADEDVIEAFYCTMRYGRDQACKQYAECFDEKTKEFDKVLVDVKDLETHTKKRFAKLTCYSRGTALETCDTNAINVAHLAVVYPGKPQKQTCVQLMKTRRSYTSVECKEGSVVPHGDHPGDAPETNSTTA